jgi:hypothetical protein
MVICLPGEILRCLRGLCGPAHRQHQTAPAKTNRNATALPFATIRRHCSAGESNRQTFRDSASHDGVSG